MSARTTTRTALALVAMASSACRSSVPGAAQLVIAVDSDLAIPAALEGVSIVVTTPSGTMASATAALHGHGGTWLPVTLGVQSGRDPDVSLTVTVTGTLGGTEVIRRVIHTGFVVGDTRLLRVWLASGCAGRCPGQSCTTDGVCADDTTPARTLAVFTQPAVQWSPPVLVDPQVVSAVADGALTLDDDTDYIVRLPHDGSAAGHLWTLGGHHVVVMGGRVHLPAGISDLQQRRALYLQGATGVVHVEGVTIDAENDQPWEPIVLNTDGEAHFEHVRATGGFGQDGSMPADNAVLDVYSAADVRIDRFTGTGSYLGLRLDGASMPVGAVTVQHTNLAYARNVPVGAGQLLVLAAPGGGSCPTGTRMLSDVYLAPAPGQSLVDSVIPGNDGSACSATRIGNDAVSWSGGVITGTVQLGTPPGGAYVPEGLAGGSYVPAGYLDAP